MPIPPKSAATTVYVLSKIRNRDSSRSTPPTRMSDRTSGTSAWPPSAAVPGTGGGAVDLAPGGRCAHDPRRPHDSGGVAGGPEQGNANGPLGGPGPPTAPGAPPGPPPPWPTRPRHQGGA